MLPAFCLSRCSTPGNWSPLPTLPWISGQNASAMYGKDGHSFRLAYHTDIGQLYVVGLRQVLVGNGMLLVVTILLSLLSTIRRSTGSSSAQ
jgi:hypothetical protein